MLSDLIATIFDIQLIPIEEKLPILKMLLFLKYLQQKIKKI